MKTDFWKNNLNPCETCNLKNTKGKERVKIIQTNQNKNKNPPHIPKSTCLKRIKVKDVTIDETPI